VRYANRRLAGLDETGDRGAEPKYTAETNKRILAVLDQSPPSGLGRWTAPLISTALGDVHEQYVWRFLRAQNIDLAGRKSWCESNDPEFAAKAADIVGLYLDPPDGALVLAVDEKPHIQALERAQGYLPVTVSNTSNNYGSCQFLEKLIPLMILTGSTARGDNVRDWIHVEAMPVLW
jgi:hypothetical protein